MKIGKIIKYDDHTYSVVAEELDENGWGRVDYGERLVKIHNNLPEDLTKATLLHEVLHIVGEHTGQRFKEGQIDAISYNLPKVFKDNPWLMEIFK